MNLVGRDKLDAFCRLHRDARGWIENWLGEVEGAAWRTPHELKLAYGSASFLAGNTVIFNVKGNRYRMEVTVAWRVAVVVVQWVGTHAEYDARNARR